MKLAEALQERADLNKKVDELRRRLSHVLLVQEGEEPAENPAELLMELDGALARLEYLMAAINLSLEICNTTFEDAKILLAEDVDCYAVAATL